MVEFPVQYWDSCVIIALLTGTDTNRVAIINELLRLESQRKIRIVVSAMVQAEVRPLGENMRLDPKKHEEILELFDSERIEYRAVTPSIAREAARIGFQHQRLSPTDCIHIATAIEAKVHVLFTYDGAGRRRRPSEMITQDRKIGKPPLRIMEPFLDQGPLLNLIARQQP